MKAMNFTGPTSSLWKILLLTGPHAAISNFWTWQSNQFSMHFMMYLTGLATSSLGKTMPKALLKCRTSFPYVTVGSNQVGWTPFVPGKSIWLDYFQSPSCPFHGRKWLPGRIFLSPFKDLSCGWPACGSLHSVLPVLKIRITLIFLLSSSEI